MFSHFVLSTLLESSGMNGGSMGRNESLQTWSGGKKQEDSFHPKNYP